LARTAGERLTPKAAQERADAAVPLGDGWAWNQVIMDLGAGLCRPTPICAECPLVASCAWSAAERPDPDPAIGSAGVSGKQARFEGSRRQARGKVLKALNNGARPAADFDLQILSSLLADGLIEQFGTTVTLPT
jgi:A/G-specific adenine glycosylase